MLSLKILKFKLGHFESKFIHTFLWGHFGCFSYFTDGLVRELTPPHALTRRAEMGGVWVQAQLLHVEESSQCVCVNMFCVSERARQKGRRGGIGRETGLNMEIRRKLWTRPGPELKTRPHTDRKHGIIMPSANVSVRSLYEVEKYLGNRMVSILRARFAAWLVKDAKSRPAIHYCLSISTSSETDSCATKSPKPCRFF